MNKKNFYTVPTVEIIDIETSQILSGSDGKVDIYDDPTDDNASMTHKKDAPWTHTWE